MAIQFQCPKCQSTRGVSDRLVGKEIQCPDCGAKVLVEAIAADEVIDLTEASAAKATVEVPAEMIAEAPEVPVAQAQDISHLSDEELRAQEELEMAAATASFDRPKPKEGEDMDMTPMVDVTFLLLIFFMITASFSVQKTLQRPAQKPDDPSTQQVQQEQEDNPDIVTVQVDEFNAFNVITTEWDRPVGSKQDLIVALSDAHAGSGGNQPSKLVIQAHEDCIHGAVVAALDAGREAQFENFEVSTVEEFD